MKRKKTVPAEVVPKPVNDAAPVPEKDHPLYDRLFVVGFAVLLFFAMTVQTVPMSLILAVVALVLSFGRAPRLANFSIFSQGFSITINC